MLIAIAFAILTGVMWTSVGITFKYLASAKLDAQKFLLLNFFFIGFLGLIIFCKFDVVFSGEVMTPWRLIICFALSGVLNYSGMFFMQRAMSYGHSGVVWAIGQSALIVPFLVGILIFNQTGTLVQYGGVGFILLGVFIPSLAGSKNSVDDHKGSSLVWFLMALCSLVLCGFGQTLANIPSYWDGWVDNAQLRPGIGAVFSFLTVLTVFLVQRKKIFPIKRKLVVLAFGIACIMVVSLKTLFFSLDRLTLYNMGATGYPVVIGSCISVFYLYSMFVLKEKVLWQNWVGLIATIGGIIVISL